MAHTVDGPRLVVRRGGVASLSANAETDLPGQEHTPQFQGLRGDALRMTRFVWEQERVNGYHRPSWPVLFGRWNEEHPGAQFKSYNNFRTYCMRGIKAVAELNFSWPTLNE